ncbi:MAG: hypothetical protein GXP49_13140 [Deltaproteobacteria bacterium]|nr:hypothetical protein [Deltaproteobacteria bacterium]
MSFAESILPGKPAIHEWRYMFCAVHVPKKFINLSSMAVMIVLFLPNTVSAGTHKGTREKIVVMDLRSERGLDQGLTKLLNELILTEFQKTGRYEVFGERDIVSMMNFEDTKIKMTGCSDDSCLAEIGGALGVDIIVASNIGKIGDNYLLNMKMLDVKRARVRKRVSEIVKAEENALIHAIRKAVAGLTGESSADLQKEEGRENKQGNEQDKKKAVAVNGNSESNDSGKAKATAGNNVVESNVPKPGSTPEKNNHGRGINLPAWILLGVGLAAGATGGVLGGLAFADKDLSGRSFDSQSAYNDAVDSVNHKALAADVMFGIGGAALAGSAVFFLFLNGNDGDNAKKSTSVSAAVAPLEGGCVVMGRAGF